MVSIDLSVLDVPRAIPPDPEAYLRAAMAWHFGADTGSPFWLRAAGRLDFDPLTDVRSHDDLGLFPNLVDELRDVPVEDLIPRGYGTPPPIPRVFESGGTTGAPKRTAQLPDWIEQVTRWQIEDFTAGGFVPGAGLLCMMPGGPHGVGHFDRVVAERLGATFHAVDLDPRWVKKVAARGARAEVARYVDHVLEQALHILETQTVANLHATPPLLEAIANDDRLIDLVNRRIRYILLSGAHVDVDTMALFRGIFPGAAIALAFGSTMILSQAATRTRASEATGEHTDGDAFVFDPRSPYVVFRVVDPGTGAQVPYGERGQIVMNHVSKGMFIPNNLERDTAIRLPGPDGGVGDSVSEVAPVAVFGGEPVIEGVY
ncbi:phenylacetate--CoA ligase family protein [Mycolicibacterium arenosum]|uniref:Phenazine antibiotic biosynthesis protein n=1 Tax=Mycolicibacterium arenosum TaxID=2952157 RepID=A0ABT1LV49_9MYCO|nr:phenazine antibiotic biosynthesis protein [Mycolicibacterium sp. CAU 1645]MCP9270773.1 phenazine antibiotic biosynthesis protein [Mycolicibacterium sp. CAU 1645]